MNLLLIANLLGWFATFFRGTAMLCKKVVMVKLMVTLGNVLWFVSAWVTDNVPLMVCNLFSIIVYAVQLIFERIETKYDIAKDAIAQDTVVENNSADNRNDGVQV